MSKRTPGMPDHRDHSVKQIRQQSDPAADRLATLAALTMSRQNPGLVLPSLAGIPTSYSYTDGGDSAFKFARSLATLGLGSPEMWESENGNLSTFSRNALNVWLKSLGADELRSHVWFDFAIVESLYTSYGDHAPEGKLFILLETSDGAGFITIGKQIEELEREKQGLGKAFYTVLMDIICTLMRIYNIDDAQRFADGWRECIETDMQESSDDSGEELSFTEYCAANDIDFPDIDGATPACLRGEQPFRGDGYVKRCISLLKQHRQGAYREWIEPVLAMAAVRKMKKFSSDPTISRILDDGFDAGPLPSWIVAFTEHDPITQAFDQECGTLNEYSHGPTWLEVFDPANVNDVRRVLTYVQRFVEVNRNLVRLKKAFQKGASHGSTNILELDNELRVA